MGRRTNTEVAGLALVAYLPFLLSAPGQVSGDSKQALYVDPEGLLGRAGDLWDPTVGAGTVPHQQLGYLVPTGPWFWAFEQLGVPDWVAQRLWWGTLAFVAALGARWLFRLLGVSGGAAVAGALVYACSPYQLAFTARISVLLLPWAALPWLVGLTARACRQGGWRWPALFALALFLTGGVNASSLLLVGLGPLLWVVCDAARGGDRARAALGATLRIGLLAVGVSAWWVVGVRLQGAYGLPVLQLTENLRTVAEASDPGDVLRGLGNWFFYGRDLRGYSLDQAEDYRTDSLVVALTYAVPVLALAAMVVLRWAHRAYFALLVVLGTVVAVGSWPYDDPSPYGRLWQDFSNTSAGLAFRNSPRAVPLVALGLAGILAAAVAGLPARRPRLPSLAALALGALALLTLLPVARHGWLSDGLSRPEDLPAYWTEAAGAIDAGDPSTRVLEIPGSTFAAYGWGTTIDPLTPLLIERGYVAREVLPDGSAASANLVAALDRRMQLGTFEPESLAPVARLLGVGTVVLRADLEREGRFDNPAVEPLWDLLVGGRATGIGAPEGFGPPGGEGSDPELPAVALLPVKDALAVVRTASVTEPVVLAGDGEGIVDAAAAGLLDGGAIVLYSAALEDPALDEALEAGADLVLTDSNRRRIETWFYSIKDTRGPTERAGEVQPDPTGYDFRLDPFPGADDDTRTVALQVGGTVEASRAGGPERPAERAVHAADGDAATSWRVGGPDPRGATITITPDDPVDADEVRVVQAVTTTGRRIARVAIHIPGEATIVADLDERSGRPDGQPIALPGGVVPSLTVEILDTSPPAPGADVTAVGFAEIGLGDVVVEETLRLPVDLLERVGAQLDGHSLDLVLTRLAAGTEQTGRADEEPRLDRTVDLPVARTFALVGEARGPTSAASAECRDDLVTIDGMAIPVRAAAASGGLALEACSPVDLADGTHRIQGNTAAGVTVDRLVLSTDAAGGPTSVTARGTTASPPPSTLRSSSAGRAELEVDADGTPFWFVLGESHNDGWQVEVDGGTAGPSQLVNGYANGWVITPSGDAPVVVAARWTPQRLVPIGAAVSVVALGICLVLAWRTRRQHAPVLAATPLTTLDAPELGLTAPATAVATAIVVVLAWLIASPAVAVVAGIVTLAVACVPRARLVVLVAAPIALIASRIDLRPQLAWLALAVAAAVVLVDALRRAEPPP